MALLDQIQKDMVAAMKAREEHKLETIRMVKSALKKHEIDSMKPLDETTELQVLSNRIELAEKEEAEIKQIEAYMPASASEEEMDAAIAAAIAATPGASLKQMGVVMKAAQAKLAGKRVDGKVMSERVRSKLS
jgi:uncharacterized protein YqeY